MAETAVATDVHQTLDVHRGFAPQIALNSELANRIANFFQIAGCQLLDLLGISDAAGFADLSCAGATDGENGG
jgi:hypothetical protein